MDGQALEQSLTGHDELIHSHLCLSGNQPFGGLEGVEWVARLSSMMKARVVEPGLVFHWHSIYYCMDGQALEQSLTGNDELIHSHLCWSGNQPFGGLEGVEWQGSVVR